MSNNNEPVAWAVMLADGERIYDVYTIEEEAKAIDEAVTGNHGVAPLYRQPQTGSLAWIPVTERLPPTEVEVLVFSGDYDSGIHVASRDSDGLWFPGVTHWMPLPAPPYTRWSD